VLLAIALAGLLAGLTILTPVMRLFEGIEDRALDYWFLLRGQRDTAHLPILLVLIGEESLEPYGYRSPTPRRLLAKVVSILTAKGARCIGLDFVLDRSAAPGDDEALEAALAASPLPVVLVAPALERFAGASRVAFSAVEGSVRDAARWYRVTDSDAPTPSFAAALAEGCFGAAAPPADAAKQGRVLLNYYGAPSDVDDPQPTFPVLRANELAHVPPEVVQGRAVLVGSGLRELGDIFLTPFSTGESGFRESFGVELHATMLGNLLDRWFLFPVQPSLLAVLSFLLYLTAALAALFLPLLRAAVTGTLVLLAWPAWAATAFLAMGTVYPALYPLLFAALAIFLCEVVQYLTEARQARFLQATFSRYLSPEVVQEMANRGWGLDLGGESRVVTILFSDLEGFTSLSENMTPRQVVNLLNEYLGGMSNELFAEHGTIGDFIGDAIMAYFGAPVALPNHAARACRAALHMQARLDELNVGWRGRGLPELRMRIGIHTGEVVLGNIGSERRTDFTIIGDAVNLASRLEGANKLFGTGILVSGDTLAGTDRAFESRELGRIVVKGKTRPVVIHQLIAEGPTGGDFIRARSPADSYALGLEKFYLARFDEARAMFTDASTRHGDRAAAFMAGQCERFRSQPPGPGWNGAIELTTK
jgi:adenylate cyclase